MLTALPRPLAPWAGALADFGDEARAVFGTWLPTLERLLGPFARDEDGEAGEPDGFSGLGRRGRYERLSLSEWSLLDVAPEEFVRRAGSGEHLFQQVARTARTGGRKLVALFDAGPLQLGAPRLAHLAWLLVLARRAQRSGAHLQWGVLQTPSRGLVAQADGMAVRMLLAARSLEAVAPEHLSAWRKLMGPSADGDERWLIAPGHHRPAATLLGASSLLVSEPEAPRAAALDVEVLSAKSGKARAQLPLPAGVVCARLLRDPFAPELAPAVGGLTEDRLAPGAQVTFGAGGAHVLARLASGDIVALPVNAGSQRRPATLATRFSPAQGEEVAAAGWRKGKLYVLTATDDQLSLHHLRGRRWRRAAPSIPLNGMPRLSPMVLSPLVVDGDAGVFWFADAAWRLYRGDLSGGALRAFPESTLAHTWSRGCLTSVGRMGNGPLEVFSHRRDGLDRTMINSSAGLASEGFLALNSQGWPDLLAVGTGGGQWWFQRLPQGPLISWHLPATTRVFGAADARGQICLLVNAGPDRLQLVTPAGARGGGEFGGLVFPAEVEHACFSPDTQMIAVQVAGGLQVVDRAGRVRLRYGGQL